MVVMLNPRLNAPAQCGFKFPEHAAVDARLGLSDFIEERLVEIPSSSTAAWHSPVHDKM
jgi:hypothetical protein